jgi:predicted nucleotidyltransferase
MFVNWFSLSKKDGRLRGKPYWKTRPVEIPEKIKHEVSLMHPEAYLFGSRYMAKYLEDGKRVENSDWDFAFPYEGSETLELDRAKKLGWQPKESLKYMDNMSLSVYEKEVEGYKVQMCSKLNMALFKRAWESIHKDFYWDYLHKSSPYALPQVVQKEVFNQLYYAVAY